MAETLLSGRAAVRCEAILPENAGGLSNGNIAGTGGSRWVELLELCGGGYGEKPAAAAMLPARREKRSYKNQILNSSFRRVPKFATSAGGMTVVLNCSARAAIAGLSWPSRRMCGEVLTKKLLTRRPNSFCNAAIL